MVRQNAAVFFLIMKHRKRKCKIIYISNFRERARMSREDDRLLSSSECMVLMVLWQSSSGLQSSERSALSERRLVSGQWSLSGQSAKDRRLVVDDDNRKRIWRRNSSEIKTSYIRVIHALP